MKSLTRPIRRSALALRACAPPVLFVLVGWLLHPVAVHAQNSSVHPSTPPVARAARVAGAIVLDGQLDEPDWAAATAATDFRQAEPNTGSPATQRTEVRFLYDVDALYVGARMYDDRGAAGVRTRMVRRDTEAESDQLDITFDTFHDHLGRTSFSINPSGVKLDSYGPGGANSDSSWDPIWDAVTTIDSLGWAVELRIPLSQLRFPADSVQAWGLQLWRVAARLGEVSMWSFWGPNDTGGPSWFGHLEGLELEGHGRGAEFLPYVVGRSTNIPVANSADPFADAHDLDYRIGGDVRYLLTSNLTLNATINPDFGQVEVDPAVVNLSAFETFYPEKRPFFVEGSGLFRFGGLNCYFCSNVSGLSLFYPRRIGRQPQGAELAGDAGEYVDIPDNTDILAAAKVTGRTGGGWSVGVLNAMTAREHAPVAYADGARGEVEVEPFTNYFVARMARDFAGGSRVVRGMATSVLRSLGDSGLRTMLPGHAETFGLEGDLWWGRRTYRLMTTAAYSQVSGEAAAIDRLQRSSARYYQRPDRDAEGTGFFQTAYDSTVTHLRGWAAYARLSKEAGTWNWELNTNIRSPGFESNDLGFLSTADYAWMGANIRRNWNATDRFYRFLSATVGGQQQYNFDGDLTQRQVHASVFSTLRNNWEAGAFVIVRPEYLDDRLLRGGPIVGRPATWFASVNLETDSRRTLVLATEPSIGCTAEGSCDWNVGLDMRIRPVSNVQLSFGPAYSQFETDAQIVTAVDDPTAVAFYGRRYVVADLHQGQFSLDTRVNVTFSPTLTFELFLQPLIAAVDYREYKEFETPGDRAKLVYGRDVGTITESGPPEDISYTVDPDGGGPAAAFQFGNPDFGLQSIRGNAVLRWEFRPGSTLYFVWTQDRAASSPCGDFDFGRDVRALRNEDPENIFLVKMTWWLGL